MQLVGTIGLVVLVGGAMLFAVGLIVSALVDDIRRHDYEGCFLIAIMVGFAGLVALFATMMKGGLG